MRDNMPGCAVNLILYLALLNTSTWRSLLPRLSMVARRKLVKTARLKSARYANENDSNDSELS